MADNDVAIAEINIIQIMSDPKHITLLKGIKEDIDRLRKIGKETKRTEQWHSNELVKLNSYKATFNTLVGGEEQDTTIKKIEDYLIEYESIITRIQNLGFIVSDKAGMSNIEKPVKI